MMTKIYRVTLKELQVVVWHNNPEIQSTALHIGHEDWRNLDVCIVLNHSLKVFLIVKLYCIEHASGVPHQSEKL